MPMLHDLLVLKKKKTSTVIHQRNTNHVQPSVIKSISQGRASKATQRDTHTHMCTPKTQKAKKNFNFRQAPPHFFFQPTALSTLLQSLAGTGMNAV
jgi:hypothetical protein